MKLSVVIPTKNRPNDLLIAIKSVINQKKLPDQIVIIDQSESKESFNNITKNVLFPKSMKLDYIHDSSISGLVSAKSNSLKYARHEIITFLEDDIKLDFNYIKEISNVFKNNFVMGCSGIITNANTSSNSYLFFHKLTHFGIFKDMRPRIYKNLKFQNKKLVRSNVISGGLSSWRADVFKKISFDSENKFHMIEDFEFSYRFNKIYPRSLYITSDAKLEHYFSPNNRDSNIRIVGRKIFEFIVFFKKNYKEKLSIISLFVLIMSNFILVVFKTIFFLNINYFKSFSKGLLDGIKHKLVI